MMSRILCPMLMLFTLIAAPLVPVAADPLRWPNAEDRLEVREVMIPMRDGVRLHTVIVSPKGVKGPLPMLFQRTPYGASKKVAANRNALPAALGPGLAELEDYIWVYQDIRGRNGSEGKFLMMQGPAHMRDPRAVDDTTDSWDSVDWMVKNVPDNNGRVGLWGTSYDGWTVLMALLDPHPAVRAAVPVNPAVDTWMGDDWFHHGAFRAPYAFEYEHAIETSPTSWNPYPFNRDDAYNWWLKAGSAEDVGKRYLNDDRYGFWKMLLAHPAYDDFWKRNAIDSVLAASKAPLVPTMHIHGWFDQEDMYGGPAAFAALEKRDGANDRNFFVAGPWHHGQSWSDGSSLAGVNWDSNSALDWRRNQLAPFLAHYLKDGPDPHQAPVTLFNTGTHQWEKLAQWPRPEGVQTRRLYLGSGGTVGWQAPAAEDRSSDSYISDPAKPVPYQARPIRRIFDAGIGYEAWKKWLATDQRFADGRPDVLTYVSEPLDEAVTIRGSVVAHLFASTMGSDADWVVKLIDVYPDQDPIDPAMSEYQLMISGDILRGRYRENFTTPKAITPNKPLEYSFSLPPVNHSFKKGHRIMVQVQSSWFPLYDRNPQSFVPNIMKAKPGDYKAATQTIHHGAALPSNVELQVVTTP